MLVSGWMLLRLKESIKVPERALDEVVGRHFRETVHKQTNKQTNKRMNKSESNHVPYITHNIQCTCTYPISRKICRISDRTFIRGWK